MDLIHAGARGYTSPTPAATVLVLAHGAGAGQDHPFMVAAARGLAARGVDVVTFDFPYMAQRRRIPDRAPVLERRFREAADAARTWSSARRLCIGGKSMGGRMATHLGAQGVEALQGIVVLGYPLHPPGKPEQKRMSHLPAITAPVLIVQGERDVFGTPEELTPVVETMPARVTLHVVPGADHSLWTKGQTRGALNDSLLDFIARWIESPGG
jgi:hypothetical protein